MAKAKASKGPKEVSNASISVVKRVVADLEAKQASGKLTKAAYAAAVKKAKAEVGKDWPDVAEAIENFKP